MGFPAVSLLHSLKALLPPLIPGGISSQGFLQSGAQRLAAGDIHQQTVAASAQDVDGTPIVGGHHRQTTGRGFDQGQTKGFGERRVHKHATASGCPAIDRWNLRTAVMFGIGDLAVEILTIDGFEHVMPFLPLTAFQRVEAFAVAEHQQQVGLLAQQRTAAKGINQGGDVLAPIRPAHRQEAGPIRLAQEGAEELSNLAIFTAVAGLGLETGGVDPRWNHLGHFGVEMAVTLVLNPDFLPGAGDHQAGSR